MARAANILLNSIPAKGFKGMREDRDPRKMEPGECIRMNGLRLRDGLLDGKTSGSGDPVNTTAFGFDIYDAAEFRSSSGKNFILALTSTGKIIYTANGWEDWDNEATTKSFAETADGTDLVLESGSPHLHISWVERGNRDIIFSNGIDSYIIDGSFWPGGALKLTTNTDLPPFIRGLFLGGRTLLDDGERCWLSSPTDPNRFRSTLEERLDDVYDDNQWAAAAAQGVSGYNTALCQMNETSAFLATQNGVFWIGLTPDEDGISRLNIICALKKAGCAIKNAAYVNEFGIFSFYSNHEGGTWLMMGRGSYSNLPGDPINLDAEAGFWVREMAPGIRKTLQGIYRGDSALIGCGKDTRQEFEQVAPNMRLGADTENDPGWMMLGTANKLAYTPRPHSNVWDMYEQGQDYLTLPHDPAHPVENVNDGNPTYPDTGSPTYFKVNCAGSYAFLMFRDANYSNGIYADGAKIQGLANNSAWQEITINRYCSVITLSWWIGNRPDGDYDKYVLQWNLSLDIPNGPQFISKVRIYGLSFVGTGGVVTGSNVITVGEIELYGSSTDQATYIDEIQKVEGLTANSQLEFGRFLAGFRKIDSDYYPIFRIRVGKSATLDTLGTSTLAAAATAGGYTLSVAAVSTGVEVGDKITITDGANSETKYITAISGTTITVGTALSYNHASGLTVTYTGSNAAAVVATNWSGWTTLTLAQITAGYKFSALNYRTAVPADTPAVSDASGNLWTQIKVTFNLKKSVGFSSATDFWRFQFLKGTLALANHMIQSCYDNSLIFAAPLPGGTANNIVFGHKVDLKDSGSFVLDGQEIKAFVHSGIDYYAFMGRSWVKYWQGYKNYRGNSSVHSPFVREWLGAGIDGEDISPLKMLALVRYYVRELVRSPILTIDSSAWSLYLLDNTLAGVQQRYNWEQSYQTCLDGDGNVWSANIISISTAASNISCVIRIFKHDPISYQTSSWDKTVIVHPSVVTYVSCICSIVYDALEKKVKIFAAVQATGTALLFSSIKYFSMEPSGPGNTNSYTVAANGGISVLQALFKDYLYLLFTSRDGYANGVTKAGIPSTFNTIKTSISALGYNAELFYSCLGELYAAVEWRNAVNAYFVDIIQYNSGSPVVKKTITGSMQAISAGSTDNHDYVFYVTATGDQIKYVYGSGDTWSDEITLTAGLCNGPNMKAVKLNSTRILLLWINDTGSGNDVQYSIITEDGFTAKAVLITAIQAAVDTYAYPGGINVVRDDITGIIYITSLGALYKVYKLAQETIADDSALVISLETDTGENIAYADTGSLADSYQPADGRVPQTGKVNYMRPKISTSSPVEVAAFDLAATK